MIPLLVVLVRRSGALLTQLPLGILKDLNALFDLRSGQLTLFDLLFKKHEKFVPRIRGRLVQCRVPLHI